MEAWRSLVLRRISAYLGSRLAFNIGDLLLIHSKRYKIDPFLPLSTPPLLLQLCKSGKFILLCTSFCRLLVRASFEWSNISLYSMTACLFVFDIRRRSSSEGRTGRIQSSTKRATVAIVFYALAGNASPAASPAWTGERRFNIPIMDC